MGDADKVLIGALAHVGFLLPFRVLAEICTTIFSR
jgi:hypothetical protein